MPISRRTFLQRRPGSGPAKILLEVDNSRTDEGFEIDFAPGRALLPRDRANVSSTPAYPLRGHQLGYRPKTNSYDGWNVSDWHQYTRDLVVFGVNAIEILPSHTDDDAVSPHFPLPPEQMMVKVSKLADLYGLVCFARDASGPQLCIHAA